MKEVVEDTAAGRACPVWPTRSARWSRPPLDAGTPSSLAHQGKRGGGGPGADGRRGEEEEGREERGGRGDKGRGEDVRVVNTHCKQVRFTY